MAIPVTCACGNTIQARDGSAGKTLRCPRCAAALYVPAPGEAADPSWVPEGELAAAQEGRRCSSCGAQAPAFESACPSCGHVEHAPGAGRRRRTQRLRSSAGRLTLSPEVALVILLLGVDLFVCLKNLGSGSSPGQSEAWVGGALIVGVAVGIGLVRGARWGWWLGFALMIVRSGMAFWAYRIFQYEWRVNTSLLVGFGIAYLVGAALLVACRARGAYPLL